MKTTYAISTAALFAFIVAGTSARAQEPVSPAAASDGATTVTAAPPPATVSANSKIRIVRLSESRGEVQLDRKLGKGFEGAMANLPIIEGARLKTAMGVAEVEFEDNSTVRVAPNSLIEFTQLELTPTGTKVSGINVVQGMVYVSLMNNKGNDFTVTAGKDKIMLPPDSHVRLQLAADQAHLAVLHGDATVQGEGVPTRVEKNKTMSFSLAGQGEPTIAKTVADEQNDQLDNWDHQAVQYHKSYANATSFGGMPYSYGINDMNYYGSFSSGCGMQMWRPYFAGANWDPYGSGAWAYYQNTGYSWVSPYPWGWTPYHYGSWSYCQGVGWGWQPGGAWMGLANNSFTSNPTRPRPPIHSPLQSTLVPVNLKANPVSGLSKSDTFVFRNGSAGLGVPRGTMGKLNHFSGQTLQHGEATTNVYYGGQRAGSEAPGHATIVGQSQGGGRFGSNAPSASVGSASRGSYSGGGGGMSSGASAGGGHMSSGVGGGAGGRH